MSGHSKWSSIKHKKAALDSKRGKIFTKLIRAITVAAREGGGDPDSNATLRLAVDKARAQNMPKDSIEKAIKRGSGALDGANYESIQYEGYGPGGVAILVEVLTDNRNRTVADVRHIFTRANGSLGADGCVSWMFDLVGQIILAEDQVPDEDDLMLVALDHGADDIEHSEGQYVISCQPETLWGLKQALIEAGYTEIEQAEVTRVAKNTVNVEGKEAEQVIRLLTALEDHDDVQQVSCNCDIDDDLMEQFG
ncbi:MAG: YebC/PmpR family DNA-binding transcriptional regulator [Bradymonadales bacterium]|nr:YebC/PmpR family DNA-binding transcriptional regulator [Bradymonadales bacterium]